MSLVLYTGLLTTFSLVVLVDLIPYYQQGAHSSEAEEKYNLKATLKTTNSPSSNFKVLPVDIEEIVSLFCDAQSLLHLLSVNKHWKNLLAKETLGKFQLKTFRSPSFAIKRCLSFPLKILLSDVFI